MTTPMIGKLDRVSLREVWRHEAHDFTQWLENNIQVLNDALDLRLVNVDREQAAGTFSVDLVAEDEGGGTVIIENQLERSNHDHLGKLITYLTAMDARAAIWIVSDPRPEHVAAITWLNESSSGSFYMVKVEAVRIGDSPAAPLFTLIVGPSEEAREVGNTKKEIAERYGLRKRWWTALIARSAPITRLHAHISPKEYSWIGTSSGVRGLDFNYVVTKDDCSAELYIDRGRGAEAETKAIFDQLSAHRQEIDQAFGEKLTWDWVVGRRGCRIRHTQSGGGYRSPEEKWPALQDAIVRDMDRLEKAVRPYLNQLKKST